MVVNGYESIADDDNDNDNDDDVFFILKINYHGAFLLSLFLLLEIARILWGKMR